MNFDFLPKDWKNPEWHKASHVHDWRNYPTDEIKDAWQTFTDHQKMLLVMCFDEIASTEEWE